MFSKVQVFTRVFARLTPKINPQVITYSDFKMFKANDILSKNEILIYKKLFDKMDSNRDGFLTKGDIKKGLLDYVNYAASEQELSETMETLDSDQDGSVCFDEFIGYIAWSRQIRTEEAIKNAFHSVDKNSDGLINKEELREALQSLGYTPEESLLDDVMQNSAADMSGTITLEEFRTVFHKTEKSE